MGPGPIKLGKLAVFRLKLGKSISYIVFMYEISIAKLIPTEITLPCFLIYKLFIKMIRQYHNSGITLLHIFLIFSIGEIMYTHLYVLKIELRTEETNSFSH